MRRIDINTQVEVLTPDELSTSDLKLVEAARRATRRAYSPYSHFCVGVALRLDGVDEIVEGSNQENVAYPSGLCAERTAAYYAHSRYPDARFEAIAIAACPASTGESVEQPITPCGACRQALLEYERLGGKPIRVLLVGAHEVYALPSVSALLPLAFVEF